MAFSEETKLIVKRRAHFSCCLCHALGVEVHHIVPQAEGGPHTEDNAAPLCPSCHEAYGANHTKRKFIREARDFWYEICEKRFAPDPSRLEEIEQRIRDTASKDDLVSATDRIISTLLNEPYGRGDRSTAELSKDIPRSGSATSVTGFLDDFTNQIIGEYFEEFVRNQDHDYYYHYKRPFSFIDLFIRLHSFFVSGFVGREPLLKNSDINAFCKTLLDAFGVLADGLIGRANEELKLQLETVNQEIEKMRETVDLTIPREGSSDFDAKLNQVDREFRLFHERAKPFYEKREEIFAERLEKAKDSFKRIMSNCLGNLFKKYGQCESPAERALVIGIVAHAERLADDTLLRDALSIKVELGGYRVDLVLHNKETNAKTIIEIEDNTRNKTDEIVAAARAQQRDLVSRGYKFLTFHSKEIEQNLQGSVYDLEEAYSGRILDHEKRERLIQEARASRKQLEGNQ